MLWFSCSGFADGNSIGFSACAQRGALGVSHERFRSGCVAIFSGGVSGLVCVLHLNGERWNFDLTGTGLDVQASGFLTLAIDEFLSFACGWLMWIFLFPVVPTGYIESCYIKWALLAWR